LRLFTPSVPVGPQVDDDAVEFGNQRGHCWADFRPGFRPVSFNGF
jgi:hypothetical protein